MENKSEIRIACLGDSLTFGFGLRRAAAWPHLLGEMTGYEVLNFGVNGDSTAGMLARFAADVVPAQPTHVIVLGGANDITMGVDPNVAASNLRSILYQAVQKGMHVLMGLTVDPDPEAPEELFMARWQYATRVSELEELREAIRRFRNDELFPIVDFRDFLRGHAAVYLDDGVHLNEEGNRLIAEGLAPLIRKRGFRSAP